MKNEVDDFDQYLAWIEELVHPKKLPELTIDEFLDEYKSKWIRYCEIIVLKNGKIVIANPSHVKRLIALTGETEDEIYKKMPVYESPVHWLVSYTGYISIWFNMQLMPNEISSEQEKTIEILIKENMIIKEFCYLNPSDKTVDEVLYEKLYDRFYERGVEYEHERDSKANDG